MSSICISYGYFLVALSLDWWYPLFHLFTHNISPFHLLKFAVHKSFCPCRFLHKPTYDSRHSQVKIRLKRLILAISTTWPLNAFEMQNWSLKWIQGPGISGETCVTMVFMTISLWAMGGLQNSRWPPASWNQYSACVYNQNIKWES